MTRACVAPGLTDESSKTVMAPNNDQDGLASSGLPSRLHDDAGWQLKVEALAAGYRMGQSIERRENLLRIAGRAAKPPYPEMVELINGNPDIRARFVKKRPRGRFAPVADHVTEGSSAPKASALRVGDINKHHRKLQ